MAYAMGITSTFVVLTFFFHIWATGYSTKMHSPYHPLNGKHLRVIWVFIEFTVLVTILRKLICMAFKPRWSGNPKGLTGPLKGGVILDCLAYRFNFT